MVTPTVRLRPYSHLFSQGIFAVVAFMTPVFVVLYVLTLPNSRWPAVLVLQVVATLLVFVAAWAYFGTAIWVSPTEISERGFFGRKRTFARQSIGSVVIAETYASSSSETIPQLFVCDHEGTQIVRMRGQFWSRENMEVVKSTLDVPFTVVDEAVTTGDLRRDFPGLLYWFERHPVLTALGFTAFFVSLAGIVMAFLMITGVR